MDESNSERNAQPANGVISTTKETKIMRRLNLEKVREDAKKLCARFVENVDQQLAGLLDDTISKVEDQMELSSPNGDLEIETTNRKRQKGGELSSKVFVQRDSLLTDLLEISHIQTIYNIFVAVLMLLFLNTILCDFIDSGKINLDFEMMKFAFGKGQTVLTVWVVMKLSLLAIIFPVFHYWAHNRQHFLEEKQRIGMVDFAFLILYVAYMFGLLILPVRIVIQEKLPPASTFILLSEQVRLLMKVYAFVRENIPRVLNYQPIQDDGEKSKETPCPDFGKFLYFLFVPTLVYRDNYPRTPCIRWKYVTANFLQVLACLFYIYYIFQRFLTPVFHRVGHERFTPRTLLLMVFGSMMPATLVFLITFFAILHAWMNAFAEMLRFGDRMFYKDWWNSTSFSNYYRTWNVVIHDWLYTYVYKDIYWLSRRNKIGPFLAVFMLSAVVHEYIITFAFGFFYPVLLVMFGGFGVFFVLLTDKRKARSWNVFMWTSLFIGTGLLMTLYSMEWYARANCPPNANPVIDYFVPRSWTCDTVIIE